MDYHLARMSVLDRIFNDNPNGDLYNGVIYSTRGDDHWVRIPKLPVAYPVNRDKHLYDFFVQVGPRELHTASGEAVDVGRADFAIAVARERLRGEVIGDQEQHVGPIFS